MLKELNKKWLKGVSLKYGQGVVVCFDPEPSLGNVEYKRKLTNIGDERLKHLITQMNWRIGEGNGKAIYMIGIDDDGSIVGLDMDGLEKSINYLHEMSISINSKICNVDIKYFSKKNETFYYAVIDIFRNYVKHVIPEIFVAVSGNFKVGKSTLLGIIMHDELDNGHGSSRVKMFKHSHEIISGHTSSRSIAFIGFDINDAIYNYKNCDSHAEIISNSNRIINLIDTCGYKKYMKTNLYTFSIYNLQYNIFIIDDQMLYLNQLENVMLLKIPILLVVNKFDKIKKNNRENSVLKTIHVIASMITPTSDPFFISNDQDIEKAMPSFLKGLICPVITVSCVTGQNLNLLRLFLSSVPSPNTLDQLKFESVRFEISKVHNREDGVIVVGRLISGRISLQDALFIGPNINGDFIKVSAQSIEQNHSKTNTIFAGQQSGINLGFISGCKIRAGMVIIDTHLNAIPCKEFMASITVFSQHHLFVGLEVPINVCSIRQIVKIIDIPETVEKGKPCLIKFKFKHRIECIKVMSKIIIRFNKLVAKGFVSSIIKFKLPKII